MKILIDTNVLISALIFHGKPLALLNKLILKGHTIYVTSYIEQEFKEKLMQKWPYKADNIYKIYKNIGFSFLRSSEEKFGTLRDEKDIQILSDAIFYGINVILSGDKDFLESDLEYPMVMSVSMLYDYLNLDKDEHN